MSKILHVGRTQDEMLAGADAHPGLAGPAPRTALGVPQANVAARPPSFESLIPKTTANRIVASQEAPGQRAPTAVSLLTGDRRPVTGAMASEMGAPEKRARLGGADDETRLDTRVAVIVHDFRNHGAGAGMRSARMAGLEKGARLYLDIRAETEEQLAARLAGLEAEVARHPRNLDALVRRAFVRARLAEVREAVKQGVSAPQAVRDRAEIPRTEVPRWVPYSALVISAIALFRAMARSS